MGGNRFRNVTKEVGLGDAGWSGDASVADLNGDGFPDLYMLNMQGAGQFYENVGGKTFVDSTAKYFPRTPWGTMGIKFFDYDNDGRPDLLITDMHSDMSEQSGPEREKLKARELMPEDMSGARRIGSSSATPSTRIAATASSRKSRIVSARKTTGPGDRASET